MAKIALRAYDQEIEDLIDQGKIEEGIAHCRHILAAYPKHIDSYRLLGKAFLESQRYTDAADIFQRVLSSVPDDFVAHLGMSIIRESENNLDAALWHMERAFEIQPSNQAIQDELRRLYGRRDGLEPTKIRLTRGALSRMYAHGDLYEQAIAELRAALSEDPQRPDLQILLAQVYAKAGKEVEAAETCTQLLSKLPYCFEANRLLAKILLSANREEEAGKYLRRVYALDPYAAHAPGNRLLPREAPEQVITVDRLEHLERGTGGLPPEPVAPPAPMNEIAAPEDSEPLPDWLSQPIEESATAFDTPLTSTAEAAEETPPDEPEELPDWLSELEAEQAEAEGRPAAAPFADEQGEPPVEDIEEGPAEAFETPPESEEPEIAKAEIPDWLQELEPEEELAESESPEDLEALASVLETPAEDVQPSPDWLKELDAAAPPQEEAPAEESPAETPEWVDEFEADQPEAAPEALDEELLPEGDLPDWLKELGGEAESAVPPETPLASSLESTQPSQVEEAPESPDWLKDFAKQQPTGPLPSEQTQTEEIKAWLQSLGQEAEQATAPPAKADEGTPEWLKSLQDDAEIPPAAPEPAAEPPQDSEEDAMAWLESLAAEEQTGQEAPAVEEGEVGDEIESGEWIPERDRPPAAVPEALVVEPEEPIEAPEEPLTPKPAMPMEAEPAAGLEQARSTLEGGQIEAGKEAYAKLIKAGDQLEEIIADLKDALTRHPVDIGLWQLLGDAYMKAGRLQDALDSYTKAEGLLR